MPLSGANVAQVKKLSPFRYPGGKTWLIPYIRQWLKLRRFSQLIEPFAGGGIVSLTAVAEGLVDRAVMVELDSDVAAVWETMLAPGGAAWLVDQILSFELTLENVHACLESEPVHAWPKAFVTLLRNRVQRGGIMAHGAGLIKEGENGRGLCSRWYPETLARRIREIARLRERIVFVAGDAFQVLASGLSSDQAIFVDPPYTKAARRLYRNWEVDHFRLFQLLRDAEADCLMTYDQTEEILALAEHNGFIARPIAMKNTHHAVMDELLIGRNLSWLKF
jgi:DNA adenine methylase